MAQLLDHLASSRGLARPGSAQFLVAVVEMVRELLHDLGFALRSQVQLGEVLMQVAFPLHRRFPSLRPVQRWRLGEVHTHDKWHSHICY
jgi:hypothetical protein